FDQRYIGPARLREVVQNRTSDDAATDYYGTIMRFHSAFPLRFLALRTMPPSSCQVRSRRQPAISSEIGGRTAFGGSARDEVVEFLLDRGVDRRFLVICQAFLPDEV